MLSRILNARLTKLTIFVFIFYACCPAPTNVKPKSDSNMRYLIVGTYTGNPDRGLGKSAGIYLYRMNKQNGALSLVCSSPQTTNPSYLVIHPNKHWVYAVNEEDNGSVSAFSVDTVNEKISFINKVSALGNAPCYITVDNSGKFVMVANFQSGNISIFSIQKDGSLGKANATIKFFGNGPVKERQQEPHAHMITQNKNGFIYAVDLGSDKIRYVRLDTVNKTITCPDTAFKLRPGAGPRQLIFDSASRIGYVINELNGTIGVLKVNAETGALIEIQEVTAVPELKGVDAGSADIHLTPSGKFLFATTRKHSNLIGMYKVNKQTGELTENGYLSSGGKCPRCFTIDPDEKFIFVANQESDAIATFIIDKASGKLIDTGFRTALPSPVCIKFF